MKRNIYTAWVTLFIFFFSMIGCKIKSEKVVPAYYNYHFDIDVIKKLPSYDSLAAGIIRHIDLFKVEVPEGHDYHAYRYMPASDDPDVHKTVPEKVRVELGRLMTNLGTDFIYGFDVFRDSSIKIYVRKTTVDSTGVLIEENLSYFPAGNSGKPREYPVRDSVLNKHWQYWTRFDGPGVF